MLFEPENTNLMPIGNVCHNGRLIGLRGFLHELKIRIAGVSVIGQMSVYQQREPYSIKEIRPENRSDKMAVLLKL